MDKLKRVSAVLKNYKVRECVAYMAIRLAHESGKETYPMN
jgi:hypothetical protein